MTGGGKKSQPCEVYSSVRRKTERKRRRTSVSTRPVEWEDLLDADNASSLLDVEERLETKLLATGACAAFAAPFPLESDVAPSSSTQSSGDAVPRSASLLLLSHSSIARGSLRSLEAFVSGTMSSARLAPSWLAGRRVPSSGRGSGEKPVWA